VDCTVGYAEADVRVQVKCTSQHTMQASSLSWPVEDAWRAKWAKMGLPVYFVLVVVPSDHELWLDHLPDSTVHRTGAFWCRIDPGALGASIKVPKNQRLTRNSIEEWHGDLLAVLRHASEAAS